MIARSAVLYTVLRLLAFLVPFGLLMLLPVFQEVPWLAAVFAALIGLSLSLLFLRRPLEDITSGLAERRVRTTSAQDDASAEDAVTDRSDRSGPADSGAPHTP